MNATNWSYYILDKDTDKMKVTIKTTNGPVTVYTRKEDIPSQSFHHWYLEIDANTTAQLYVTREGSGKYIALFNPDLDNQIKVDIGVINESQNWSLLFWLFILFAVFFAILSIINFFYIFKPRKVPKQSIMISKSQPENLIV